MSVQDGEDGYFSQKLRVSALDPNRANPFLLTPKTDEIARIATELALLKLRKVRFAGEISPADDGWRLEATLGATAQQACIVTAEPVTTRLDITVSRHYRPMAAPKPGEAEFDGDDEAEPLGPEIDLGQLLVEALSIALPDYPRVPDATPESFSALPDGADPIDAASLKPFAALQALKDKLEE